MGETGRQFIAETGSHGGSTTEAGYGFRKGNHYGTAVTYRTAAEMVREVLEYEYKPVPDSELDDEHVRRAPRANEESRWSFY